MLSCIFKSLFVYRYSDCVPEIRAVCIYEIGVWMKKFANSFLDDSYLEYIGWTLNDKVADVRLKCLQALLPPLYDDRNEIAGKMELFINKFRNRIVQMANDKVAEVRDLVVQFVMEGEFPEHATYLVDSLIDTHPLMKDWVCMTDLFLEEAGRNEEPLDNKQKTSLIEIVTCCVEQSGTGEPPICREIDTERMNKEIKITDHFIGVLTQLLNLYKTDPKKIVNLMTISQYFELTPCKQNDDNLETLLRLFNEIVDIHTDEEVLRTCAEFYKFLYDENYQFSRNVWLNKSQSIDTLVSKYRIASDNTIEETKYAMAACHFGLNRELSLIHTNMSVISKPAFRKRLSSYMDELRTITGSRASDVLREEDAYSILCDLLITFSVKWESVNLVALAYQPDQSLISELELSVLEKVFIDEYKFDKEAHNSIRRLGTLHKKRKLIQMSASVCVIKNYVMFFNDYGEQQPTEQEQQQPTGQEQQRPTGQEQQQQDCRFEQQFAAQQLQINELKKEVECMRRELRKLVDNQSVEGGEIDLVEGDSIDLPLEEPPKKKQISTFYSTIGRTTESEDATNLSEENEVFSASELDQQTDDETYGQKNFRNAFN